MSKKAKRFVVALGEELSFASNKLEPLLGEEDEQQPSRVLARQKAFQKKNLNENGAFFPFLAKPIELATLSTGVAMYIDYGLYLPFMYFAAFLCFVPSLYVNWKASESSQLGFISRLSVTSVTGFSPYHGYAAIAVFDLWLIFSIVILYRQRHLLRRVTNSIPATSHYSLLLSNIPSDATSGSAVFSARF